MISVDAVKQALEAIKTYADFQYFFDSLTSAEWIGPLNELHLFSVPPEATTLGDQVMFPIWPQSRYLVRVADQAPELVVRTIEAVSDTSNPRVREDFIEAALLMPPDIAVRLVPKAIDWNRDRYQMIDPERLAVWAERLAEGTFVGPALALFGELLKIEVDTDNQATGPQPRAHLDEWHYREILNNHLVTLARTGGLDTLRLLSSLLESLVEASGTGESEDNAFDTTFVSRPAIEDHPQNHGYGLDDALIVAVRDVAEALITFDPAMVESVISDLESRPRPVFERIALYLMRVHPDLLIEAAAERLQDKRLGDSTPLFHEFWLLARDVLPRLDSGDREAVLRNIDLPPSHPLLKGLDDPTEFIGRFVFKRLAVLEDVLPDPWRESLEQHRERYGVQEHPEFMIWSSDVFTGPTSPLDQDRLASMDIVELTDWLRAWQPSDDFMAPSPEGVARNLERVVTNDPRKFADHGALFSGLDPTYLRGLISGLREAAKNEEPFDWTQPLSLCTWIVDQPETPDGGELINQERGHAWRNLRQEVAQLLDAGLSRGPAAIPSDFRDVVWNVLRPLTDDPDPDISVESVGRDHLLSDPAFASINTVRGWAMTALVRYALWVKGNYGGDRAPTGSPGFDEVPEVREILVAHLDPNTDPTAAIRAVYGQWFPWLVLIDAAWAKANADTIFPEDPTIASLRDAAWNTYITYSHPYSNVFEVLELQYRSAIERVGEEHPSRLSREQPQAHLAEHLMSLYWGGTIDFDTPAGLLDRFFVVASDEIRASAISFVGRAVADTDSSIPDELVGRLMALWERRLEAATEAPGDHLRELAAFGWWFSCEWFDGAWALTQLLRVLELTGSVDVNHQVVKRLVEVSSSLPRETLRALRLIIEGDTDGWGVLTWRNEAKSILTTGVAADDQDVVASAIDLIHWLVARGHREFSEVISVSKS